MRDKEKFDRSNAAQKLKDLSNAELAEIQQIIDGVDMHDSKGKSPKARVHELKGKLKLPFLSPGKTVSRMSPLKKVSGEGVVENELKGLPDTRRTDQILDCPWIATLGMMRGLLRAVEQGRSARDQAMAQAAEQTAIQATGQTQEPFENSPEELLTTEGGSAAVLPPQPPAEPRQSSRPIQKPQKRRTPKGNLELPCKQDELPLPGLKLSNEE